MAEQCGAGIMGDSSEELSCNDIVNSVIQSKKNSNRIIDLEKRLLSEDESTTLSAIDATGNLFSHFIENGCFRPSVSIIDRGDADQKYCSWLEEHYGEVKSLLCDHLLQSNRNIQESSLCVLLKLLKAEGQNPIKVVPNDTWYFPKEMFQNIIKCMLSVDNDMRHLTDSLFCHANYNDLKIYALKSLLVVLESTESHPSSVFLHNVYDILTHVRFPRGSCGSDEIPGNAFVCSSGDRPVFRLKCSAFRKVFSSVWIKFLSFKLPASLYKSVLIYLHQEVLPHLKNPLLLTDFLTDSYNIGGAVSLLALNGLFFLIQKYNLEYPNFFQKLYALFQPDIITSKYKARLFYLSDLFLSSTHLPTYLVAAFVKRLSRLALFSPPHVLLIIIPFIGNLLIRHPSLKVMMHCTNKSDVTSDPFDNDASDPSVCGAVDSSLWEIKSLQSHWHPEVSKKAKFINSQLQQIEWNLSDRLELTMDDLIEKEKSCTDLKSAPMSFDKPTGLFERKEDQMCDLWTL